MSGDVPFDVENDGILMGLEVDNHSLAQWQLGLSGDVVPVVQTDDSFTEVDNLSLAELGLSEDVLYVVHTDDTLMAVDNHSLAARVIWGCPACVYHDDTLMEVDSHSLTTGVL